MYNIVPKDSKVLSKLKNMQSQFKKNLFYFSF